MTLHSGVSREVRAWSSTPPAGETRLTPTGEAEQLRRVYPPPSDGSQIFDEPAGSALGYGCLGSPGEVVPAKSGEIPALSRN